MTQPMARAVLQIQTRLRQTQSDGLSGNEPSYFSCGVFLKPTREVNRITFPVIGLNRSQIIESKFLDVLNLYMYYFQIKINEIISFLFYHF